MKKRRTDPASLLSAFFRVKSPTAGKAGKDVPPSKKPEQGLGHKTASSGFTQQIPVAIPADVKDFWDQAAKQKRKELNAEHDIQSC